MEQTKTKTSLDNVVGDKFRTTPSEYSDQIAYDDPKISFAVKYCRGKKVLDLGCIDHNPANHQSKYWLHRAIMEVTSDVIGLDLYEEGVNLLNSKGYNIEFGDAQQFDLNQEFDVLVAGDIIEHLEDFHGFITSCKKHMNQESRLLISTPNPWYWRNTIKAGFFLEVNRNPEHTCWLCPRTIRQLFGRHDMEIVEIQFGSRRKIDRLIPLPGGWKHSSFHTAFKIREN